MGTTAPAAPQLGSWACCGGRCPSGQKDQRSLDTQLTCSRKLQCLPSTGLPACLSGSCPKPARLAAQAISALGATGLAASHADWRPACGSASPKPCVRGSLRVLGHMLVLHACHIVASSRQAHAPLHRLPGAARHGQLPCQCAGVVQPILSRPGAPRGLQASPGWSAPPQLLARPLSPAHLACAAPGECMRHAMQPCTSARQETHLCLDRAAVRTARRVHLAVSFMWLPASIPPSRGSPARTRSSGHALFLVC